MLDTSGITGFFRRFTRRQFLTVAVLIVALAGVWFFFFRGNSNNFETLVVHSADFVQEVAVSGTVKPAHSVDLGFEQSGRVSGVYASVGQAVGAGTVLVAIESGDVAATVAEKQAALQSAQAKLAGLKAGSRPEDIKVAQAQAAKAHQDLANMYAAAPTTLSDAISKATDAVRTQLSVFFSNADSSSPQLVFSSSASQSVVDALSERVSAGRELDAWQSDLAAVSASSDSATLEAALKKAEAHLVVITDFLNTMSDIANNAITLPPGVSTAATLKAYVSTAQSEVNTARASVDTKLSDIASQKILAQQLDAQLSVTLAGATQEDIDAQVAQVAVAQANLENAQAQAGKTRIVAPFSGTVTSMDAKVGQIVSPNTSEVSMISNGTFQIETYIPEVSIVNVKVGNTAKVTLDAYGSDVFFDAAVVAIDPAETMRDGVSTYKTTLQFSKADARIRSGMTAATAIETSRTANALAAPIGATYERDGQTYLQVARGGKAEEIAVTLGSSSSVGSVVVMTGLHDGDAVILNPSH